MSDGEEKRRRRRRRPRRRSGGRGDRSPEGTPGPNDGGADAADGARNGNARSGPANARSGSGSARSAPGNRRRSRNRRSRPRNARGGAGPRARRARFGENWWARRWIEVLEDFQVGRRLGRGRSYARQGQVVDHELGKGFVTAQVQGSRDAPYLVRMHFSMLSSTDWKRMTRALAADPAYAGPLLAGEMPESIEDAFRLQNLSLFPAASGDLKAACSCPDQANPCKHVAAVYYLLGEEFDRDPFLIFRLRGIERGDLLEGIRAAAARQLALAPPAPEPEPEAEPAYDEFLLDDESEEDEEAEAAEFGETEAHDGEGGAGAAISRAFEPAAAPAAREPEPLPADVHAFWTGGDDPRSNGAEVRIPPISAALPRRLGGFAFWRGDADCGATIDQIYRNASVAGLDVYLGEPETRADDD